MLGIIVGAIAIVGIIVAVLCSVRRTPDHLRGYYGGMFWTIAGIAIVALIVMVVLGLI